MKYLKKFENTIKHTDDIAINHPLRNFSRDFEDIIINIEKLDNIQLSQVRRYFIDDITHKIKIVYSNKIHKFLTTNMYVKDNNVIIDFLFHKHFWNNLLTKITTIFMTFILNEFDKYIISNLNLNNNIILTLNFPLTEKDYIIREFQDFKNYVDFYNDTINYNL